MPCKWKYDSWSRICREKFHLVLGQFTQGFIKWGPENLQGWRQHSTSGQHSFA